MRAFLAVTDNDWFRFLRAQRGIDEVNFWQPSGRSAFRALRPGQPFLFKLHHPENFIVGGGFFAHFSLLPARLAWEAFGIKNGAADLGEMRRRIAKYRHRVPDDREQQTVGCIILVAPFFLEDRDWIPVPADFSRNIVRGKGYDLTRSPGRELWLQVAAARAGAISPARPPDAEKAHHLADGPMFSDPVPVRRRLGQGSFRVVITDLYHRKCAVTGGKALPTLEAAHIRPVTRDGRHATNNGLLLRSDIHRLFDDGYVAVDRDLCFRVSSRLKKDFDNGEEYLRYAGQRLWVPDSVEDRPDPKLLEWHADTVFRG
jgi:putative restriction endonuclease